LKIEFTPRALNDLEDIREWFRESDPATADRIISRIRQTIAMFESFPLMGHEGKVRDTREFKVTGLPYLPDFPILSSMSQQLTPVSIL
jgi:toxin ParE1/3/4